MLFSVLSLVLLKLSQFLYIRHSTYSQCSFSWFTILVPQLFLLPTANKIVTWNKDNLQNFIYSIWVEINIIIIVASRHQWFSTCLTNHKMVIFTNAGFAFLALESERSHLLSCLCVTFPKNTLNASFTSSPLTSPWVWEQVFISSATSNSSSATSNCSSATSSSSSSSHSKITSIDVTIYVLSISLKSQ